MTEPRKPDLRDKGGAPTTLTDLDERLAGNEPAALRPDGGNPLRTPEVGKVPDGQATKS